MKLPHTFHAPKFDLLGLQTVLELAAGAVATVLLLRWMMF
jgi:hypothetical protein